MLACWHVLALPNNIILLLSNNTRRRYHTIPCWRRRGKTGTP